MLANIAGIDGGIVLLIAIVVIFGGSQLPKIARNVGSAGKEFRNAQKEAEAEDAAKKATPEVTAAPVVTAQAPAPAPAPVVAQAPVAQAPVATPAAAAAADSDKVTISKAELAALLDERLGKQDSGHSN